MKIEPRKGGFDELKWILHLHDLNLNLDPMYASSSQRSNSKARYGPNCLSTFKTKLTYRFNGRTAQPLEHTAASSSKEPISRYQIFPSM